MRLATSSADRPEPSRNAFSRLPISSKRKGKVLLLTTRGLDGRHDLGRRDRRTCDLYAEGRKRVLDSRHDGGRDRHDAAFTHALDAEWIEWRGRFHMEE